MSSESYHTFVRKQTAGHGIAYNTSVCEWSSAEACSIFQSTKNWFNTVNRARHVK